MCLPLSALLALTCFSAPGPAQEMVTAPSAVEPVRALAAELGTHVGLFTGGYAFADGRWEAAYFASTSSARYLLGGFTLGGGRMSLLPWSAWEQGTCPDGRLHIHDGSVSGDAAGSWERFDVDVGLMRGWDVYPEGLYLFLQRFRDLGIPLLVTENGMADTEGIRRTGYLRSHVYAVEQAVKEGVDVRGYFHWSLEDFQDIARNLGLTPVP